MKNVKVDDSGGYEFYDSIVIDEQEICYCVQNGLVTAASIGGFELTQDALNYLQERPGVQAVIKEFEAANFPDGRQQATGRQRRSRLTHDLIGNAFKTIRSEFGAQLKLKGDHILVSRHEILGALEEEVDKVRLAVRKPQEMNLEVALWGVGVIAVLGVALIDSEKMDW